VYDENGDPSESLVTDWNEHNDHADGNDPEPDFDDEPAPAADAWTYAVPAEPQGAYTIAAAGPWFSGPLRPVVHRVNADEDDIMSAWATRLCWLDDPRTATVEPAPPRMYRSADLALPSAGGHGAADGYTYPLILRFTDPAAAAALAAQLDAIAAELRAAAPDPFDGCVNCVRADAYLCDAHKAGDQDGAL
jgi:hypothetical protein